jgi:undecaprenyl-diphosphatase
VTIWQSVVLGVIEGLTEFLPVSSTGHLTVAEKLFGLKIDDKSVTGFTAVIQVGAIAAVLLYFRADIARLAVAGVKGLVRREARSAPDFRLAWLVVAGSVPIGIVGLAGKNFIEGPLRNLWVVAVALVVWSAAMWWAERVASQRRGERELTLRDALFVGVLQCLALVPGVSRSGATISAGLWRGIDRVGATRLSFFLAIPALVAAGLLLVKDAVSGGVGLAPTLVGTAVSFVVAYASIAWLLRFVAYHRITAFVPYRVLAGLTVVGLLLGNVITAH